MPYLLGVYLFVVVVGFGAFLALDLIRAALVSHTQLTWFSLLYRVVLIGLATVGSLALAGSLGWVQIGA